MDYTTLAGTKDTAGSIKYWVRHDSVPVAYILESAQNAIYAQLRCREMLKRAEGTIAEDATTITLPTDMLEPVWLGLRGQYKSRIRLHDHEHFESRVGEDENNELYPGTPTEATYDGTLLYLNAKADQEYPYRLWYMHKPAVLGSGNTTNFLTTRYPHMLEAYLKHYAWEDRDEHSKSQSFLKLAVGYLNEAKAEYDMWKQQVDHEFYWSER